MLKQAAICLAASKTENKLVPEGSTQCHLSRESRNFGRVTILLSHYLTVWNGSHTEKMAI